MAPAPREVLVEGWALAEEGVWAEVEWGAPEQGLAQKENAFVPNVVLLPPIK